MDLESSVELLDGELTEEELIQRNRLIRNQVVKKALPEAINDPKMLTALKGFMADNDKSALSVLRIQNEQKANENEDTLIRLMYAKLAEDGNRDLVQPKPAIAAEPVQQEEKLDESEFNIDPSEAIVGNDTEASIIDLSEEAAERVKEEEEENA